jgi:transcriptional regulator with XRE-family HTH domain
MKYRNNEGTYERMRIGANIRKWRNIKEVKQKELASCLKISEASVSNMENDLTDITLSQLENISLALNVPLEKLFSDPQITLNEKYSIATDKEKQDSMVMDKEFAYSIINTIEKKDEQLKTVIDNMMETMKKLVEWKEKRTNN